MCNRYFTPAVTEIEQYWQVRPAASLVAWAPQVFPRSPGPFLRAGDTGNELVVGQWGLIPHFAKSPRLKYSTNNARSEELAAKATYRQPWARGQRCIIPARSFDEPCWETGRNVWWRFRRADGEPWGLAGLWNAWLDQATGEIVESYTMLTINADAHPLMRRMHKPEPGLPAEAQDKRSVVPIERADVEQWLHGSADEARQLLHMPSVQGLLGEPVEGLAQGSLL